MLTDSCRNSSVLYIFRCEEATKRVAWRKVVKITSSKVPSAYGNLNGSLIEKERKMKFRRLVDIKTLCIVKNHHAFSFHNQNKRFPTKRDQDVLRCNPKDRAQLLREPIASSSWGSSLTVLLTVIGLIIPPTSTWWRSSIQEDNQKPLRADKCGKNRNRIYSVTCCRLLSWDKFCATILSSSGENRVEPKEERCLRGHAPQWNVKRRLPIEGSPPISTGRLWNSFLIGRT